MPKGLGTWLSLSGIYCVALLALYGRTLHYPFRTDDFCLLYNASCFRSPLDVFLPHGLPYLRPTQQLFFWLLYPLCGMNSFPYRFLMLGAHLATALLVALLVASLNRRWICGAVAGLVFISYRHNYAVVCWLAENNEVLTGAVMVSCLLCYYWWLQTYPAKAWYLATLFFLVVSLLSKESAFILPLILLQMDWLLGCGRGYWWRRHLLFWLVSGAVVGWRLWMAHSSGGVEVSPNQLLLAETYRIWMEQTLQVTLGASVQSFRQWNAISLLAAYVLYAAAVAWTWRRAPLVAFFLLWTLSTSLLYACHGSIHFPRYYFLGSIGTAGLVGSLAPLRWNRAAALYVALVAAYVTWQSTQVVTSAEKWQRKNRQQMAAQIPRILQRLGPSGTVYVFNPSVLSIESRAVALYGQLPASRIRDWYDLPSGAVPPPGSVMIFWDQGNRSFYDMTDPLLELIAHPPPRRPAAPQYLTGWNDVVVPHLLHEWSPQQWQRRDHMLVSPEIDLNPFDLHYVEVSYCVHASGDDIQQALGCTSDLVEDAAFHADRACYAWLTADGLAHQASYYLTTRASNWSGEIRRLLLEPAASVEISRIRIFGPPPRRPLWF